MNRFFMSLMALPLLAGCGGNDISMTVDKKQSTVLAELAKIDPNALTHSANVKPVTTSRPDANTVIYTLPGAKGSSDGEIRFEVDKLADNATKVEVDVDIPFITRNTGSGRQFLDEDAMEDTLKGTLREWRRDLEAGRSTHVALRDTSQLISAFAIGMQDFDEFEDRALGAMMQQAMLDYDSGWDETSGDWGGDGGSTDWSYDAQAADNDYVVDDHVVDDVEAEDGGWGY